MMSSDNIYFGSLASIFYYRVLLSILLLTVFVVYIRNKFRSQSQLVKLASVIPGPGVLTTIRDVFTFMLFRKRALMALQAEYLKRYGTTFKIWIGKNLFVAFADVQDLETIFRNQKIADKKPAIFNAYHKFIGDSLSDNWRADRQRLQPFFTKQYVISKIPEINDQIYKCIEIMKKHEKGNEFNILDNFLKLFFNIIGRVLIECDGDFDDETLRDLKGKLYSSMNLVAAQMFLPLMNTKTCSNFLFKYFLNPWRNQCLNSIRKNITEKLSLIQKEILHKDGKDSEMLKSSFLWSSYVVEEKARDEGDMLKEILHLLLTGTETTSHTTAFVLLLVAMHPEVQEKIYQEIQQVFSDEDRPADYRDIERLVYLDQVIKEGQRLFPGLRFSFRNAHTDTKIGTHTVPAGSTILINIGGVHLNPIYYSKPFDFNPDNFSPAAAKKRPKYSYIPFGGGSRICPGKFLAEIDMRLTLIAIFRTFVVHTSTKMEDIKLKFRILNRPINGFSIRVNQRNSKQ